MGLIINNKRPLSKSTTVVPPWRPEPPFMPLFGHCVRRAVGQHGQQSGRSIVCVIHWRAVGTLHFFSAAAGSGWKMTTPLGGRIFGYR